MPRGDQTGPRGTGAMTGRGLGNCDGTARCVRGGSMQGEGRGMGRPMGRPMGRGMGFNQNNPSAPKEVLTNQKEMLEERLNSINNELGRL